MRGSNDTFRVTALVGLGVLSGLLVAGFVNSDADAHATATRALQEEGSPPTAARKVRVVYSGPLVATGVEPGDRTARPVAIAAPAPETQTDGRVAVQPAPTRLVALSDRVEVENATKPSDLTRPGIDLNSASIEQLNALHGGGRIGRAIIQGRPYASPDDLLRKRVLNRATYARVKDQVTVR